MILYISIWVFLFLTGLVGCGLGFNQRHISFFITVVAVFFCGSRVVGSSPDDMNYYHEFLEQNGSFEFLFDYFSRIMYVILDENINAFFFAASFLSMLFLFLVISRFDRFCFFSLMIYLCHIFLYRDMIQIRAAISYNVVFLMYVFVWDRKKIASLIAWVTATGFHYSAFFSFLVLFLRRTTLSNARFFLGVSVAFFVYSISPSHILLYFLQVLPSFFSVYFNTYIFDDGGFTYSAGLLNPVLIKTMLFSVIFQFSRNHLDEQGLFFVRVYFVSLLILLSLAEYAVFSSRLASLFSMVEIVIVPQLVSSFYGVKRYFYVSFFFFVYFAVLLLNLFQKGMLDKYSSVFFGL